MDLVRCRRISAAAPSIHASHCCGERAKGPSAPTGDWYMGYGFAGMRRSSSPHTARRHTQVPPYIPGRTADVVRRAGPMCPAAGMHRKPPDGPIRSDRVGRGLAPAAGTGHRPSRTGCGVGASRMPRPTSKTRVRPGTLTNNPISVIGLRDITQIRQRCGSAAFGIDSTFQEEKT